MSAEFPTPENIPQPENHFNLSLEDWKMVQELNAFKDKELVLFEHIKWYGQEYDKIPNSPSHLIPFHLRVARVRFELGYYDEAYDEMSDAWRIADQENLQDLKSDIEAEIEKMQQIIYERDDRE